jgi:type IX secretion system PorP/SprF family membrane protein
MLDPFRYNPAYAGLEDGLQMTGVFRQQWQGLDGAPTGQRLGIHLPLYFLRGGLGFQVENDQIGAHRFLMIQGAYNYQTELGGGILALGAAAAYQQWSLDGELLRTPDGQYMGPGNPTHNDDLLSFRNESGNTVNINAGVFYQSENFDAGLSVENITEGAIALTQLSITQLRTYHAYVASRHELGPSFLLEPSAWFRSDAIENQLDLSLRVTYNDNIFLGGSFRGYNTATTDAVIALFGFKLSPALTLAYAYDVPLSPLQSVHNGSHEVVVTYFLDKAISKGKLPPIIYHPRAKR